MEGTMIVDLSRRDISSKPQTYQVAGKGKKEQKVPGLFSFPTYYFILVSSTRGATSAKLAVFLHSLL